jgi:hypothetical protein
LGYAFSKVFGPTDSVANTKTTVGSTYVIRPGQYCVHKLHVAKGNVVNAKECAGVIEVEITGVDGTYEYAYGNGTGGATNGGPGLAAEEIECRIPAPGGATITVSVTDAEVATAVVVSLDFYTGGERVDSYSTGGAGKDPAAATELEVGTVTVTKAGHIKQIRYACGQLVDAKSCSGKLVVEVPGVSGPFEFAVGNGCSGATLGGAAHADVIDVDIPVGQNVIVTFKVTYTDAMDSATVSIAVQ